MQVRRNFYTQLIDFQFALHRQHNVQHYLHRMKQEYIENISKGIVEIRHDGQPSCMHNTHITGICELCYLREVLRG